MMRIVGFKLASLLILVSWNFQSSASTIVMDEFINIPANNKKSYEATFSLQNPNASGQFNLRLQEIGDPKKIQIFLNGKEVDLAFLGRVDPSTAVPIKLKPSNSIKVVLSGATGSGARLTMYDLTQTYAAGQPMTFEMDGRGVKSTVKQFSPLSAGEECLLQIETPKLGNRIALSAPFKILLNGTPLLGVIESLFGGTGRVIKVVKLAATNDFEVRTLAKASDVKITVLGIVEVPELESQPSDGILTFQNISEEILNRRGQTVVLGLSEASFGSSPFPIEVLVNGVRIDVSNAVVTSNTITLPNLLVGGYNKITVETEDSHGGELFIEGEFWAGLRTLRIRAEDDLGQPRAITGNFQIAGDNHSFSFSQQIPATGAVINNMPELPGIASGAVPGKVGAIAFTMPSEDVFVLKLKSVPLANNIGNLDFSQGADGWEVLGAVETVEIPPEIDLTPPPAENSLISAFSAFAADATVDFGIFIRPTEPQLRGVLPYAYYGSVSKTIAVPPGSRSLTVKFKQSSNKVLFDVSALVGSRYLFVDLVPPSLDQSQSFNYRGFNLAGNEGFVTVYMGLWAPTDLNGIILDPLASATVADVTFSGISLSNAFIPTEYSDFRYMKPKNQQLKSPRHLPMQLLSLDRRNPHCNRTAPIDLSVFAVLGASTDSITKAKVEVLQNGAIVARAELLDSPRTAPLKENFGADEAVFAGAHDTVTVSKAHVCDALFAIRENSISQQLSYSAPVNLDLVVETRLGQKLRVSSGKDLPLLQWANLSEDQRFLGSTRDPLLGGDDWIRPRILPVIKGMLAKGQPLDLRFNDFSNMHGQRFPPHIAHKVGLDVDATVLAFPPSADVKKGAEPDDQTASKLLQFLRLLTPSELNAIELIIVTYGKQPNNLFRNVLVNSGNLPDGRRPIDVVITDIDSVSKIEQTEGRITAHRDHFHIKFRRLGSE
jgi:hypothetical protein